MIQINLTFFIQMFNFIIAWKILDTFLLPYCVREVREEEKVTSALEQTVKAGKEALEEVKREQATVEGAIQHQLIQELPPVTSDLSFRTISIDSFSFVRTCDVTSQKQITKETVGFLVKRITDV